MADEEKAATDAEKEEAPAAEEAPKKRRGRRAAKTAKAAKEETPKKERAALKPGQVRVYSVEGEPVKTVELPSVFRSEIRVDLIRRAVTAFQANRRQAYGPRPRAGMRHSVRWSGKGQGVSRVPRIRGTMIGAQAPGTVGGRQAHPPAVERIWTKKVNEKERRRARNAALAAIRDPQVVGARGHRFSPKTSVPVIVQDAVEEIESASEAVEFLEAVGLYDDVMRAKDGTHVRQGRGKMRGRRYRRPRGPLLVVRDAAKARQGFGNLPGVEVVTPAGLNAEILAPGGDAGRLTIFSASALEALRGWAA